MVDHRPFGIDPRLGVVPAGPLDVIAVAASDERLCCWNVRRLAGWRADENALTGNHPGARLPQDTRAKAQRQTHGDNARREVTHEDRLSAAHIHLPFTGLLEW